MARSVFLAAFLLVSVCSSGQKLALVPSTQGSYEKLSSRWDPRFGPAPKSKPKFSEKFQGWRIASTMGADYTARFSRRRPVAKAGLQQNIRPADQVIANDALGLQLRPNIPAGYIPTGIVHADFNHDGRVDWAISMGGDSTVWIYFSRGDGSFDVPSVVPLRGVSPTNIEVADLNADGNADIILPEVDSFTVGVLLGNGDGSFQDETTYQLPTPVSAVAIADFNGDGKLDVVAGMMNNAAYGAIAFLPGDGTGHLGSPITTPTQLFLGVAPVATWLSVGDFNHDGLPDLVVRDDNEVKYTVGTYVYTNTGSGTFVIQGMYGWGFSSVVADFDEDGWEDIAILDGDQVHLVTGSADGSLSEDKSYRYAYGQGSVAYVLLAADFNGDGHLDLASTPISIGSLQGYGQDSGSMLTVMFGDGHGAFGPGHVYRGHSSAFGADVFDANGDGKPDIVTANQDFDDATIYYNVGDGTFGYPKGEYIGYIRPELYANARTTNGPRSKPIVVDVNNDGRPDVLATSVSAYGHDLIAALQGPDGNFSEKKYSTLVLGTGGYAFDLVMGDFRHTGKQDVVYIISNNAGNIPSGYIFAANQGDGSFVASQIVTTNAADYSSAVSGDFNGDGKLDFAIAGGVPTALAVFLGKGDGTFSPLAPIVISANATAAYLAYARDFTGDGVLDILVQPSSSSAGAPSAVLMAGKGDGTFGTPQVVIPNLSTFAVGDVNGDGLPDVVEFTVMWGESAVAIWLCQPGGTFTKSNGYVLPDTAGIASDPLTWLLPGREFSTPQLADFDGDGNLDILVYIREQYLIFSNVWAQFLKGDGHGNFNVQPSRFNLAADMGPFTAAEIDASGSGSELVELDGRTSSFHVIRTSTAPGLDLSFAGNPITASTGILHVRLANPQPLSATIALNSSEPSISLPASATIPAGALSVDIVFSVSARPLLDKVFTITGTTGEFSSTVTGMLAGVNHGAGVVVSLGYLPTVVPGAKATLDFEATSAGGYEGDISLSCRDLPATITCRFSSPSLHISSKTGTNFALYLDISGSATPARYAGEVVVTDGAASWITPINVVIGDFAIRVPQPAVTVPKNSGLATYQVYVDSINELAISALSFSCDGLPASLYCQPLIGDSQGTLRISGIYNLAVGTYPFNLVGTRDPLRRSVNLTLSVIDSVLTLPATDITTTTATLHASGNPGGNPLSAWFQYGTQSNLSGSTVSNTQSLGSGDSPVSIDLELHGLASGTEYFYRVSSSRENGAVLSFSTAPDPSTTLSVSSTQLDFGYQAVNNLSSSKAVTLTASENVISVFGISASAEFQQTNNCGAVLLPRSSCTINVAFQPSGSGQRLGSLKIKTNAVGNPHIINLSGEGKDFSMSSSQPNATVSAGSSASYSLSLAGSQNFSGNVTLACSNLPAYASCEFSPSSLNLNSTESHNVTLSISTQTQTLSYLYTTTYFSIAVFVPGIWAMGRSRKQLSKLLAFSILGMAAILTSCGGGGSGSITPPVSVTRRTPPGTYNIVVTASVGNLSHSQTITMTVQ